MKRTSVGFTFILSLIISSTLVLTSCSSKKSKDETAEGSSDISADVAAESGSDAAIDASAGDTGAAATDSATAGEAPAPETAEVDLGANATGDQAAATETPAATDSVAAPTTEAAPAAPTDEASSTTTANNDLFGAGSDSAAEKPAKKKSGGGVALQHIKETPFKKGGQLLNTVYIAREGDTLSSVSEKLFGKDESKKLKKANPTLKNNLKAGDKVYFNSPARPDDKDRLLVVYEDQGLPPTTYTTKEGDTLKSLAQEWFGSEAAWKEIYSINRSLASTKELPAGTELIYWPPTASVIAYTAKENTEVATGAGEAGTTGKDQNMPADPTIAKNDANVPPPPPGGGAAGTTGAPGAPGAPTDTNMAPPPPPPPPPAQDAAAMAPKPAVKKPASAKGDEMDKDMIMMMVSAGAGLLVLAILIAARRARARKAASANATQV